MVHQLKQSALLVVRVVEDVLTRHYRGGRYAFPLKSLSQFYSVASDRPGADDLVQVILVLKT